MAVAIPFNRETGFVAGEPDAVAPLIRRVLAPNPGPFTFLGTNTYIVGHGTVAIIDPGPAIDAHLQAILAAVEGETVSYILATHTHRDHSPLAQALKVRTGATIMGYGPHGAGMADAGIRVEEGGDETFLPEVRLRDGDRVAGPGWTLEGVYTPGHCSNHLCFALHEAQALFTGDHVMSWSTSVVVPPDGNMDAYMASLEKIRARGEAVLWPAHGGPVRAPRPFLDAFIAHRNEREKQILDALIEGPLSIPTIVQRIYTDVAPTLHPAAALSVHAHLIRLVGQGRVKTAAAAGLNAVYQHVG